MGGLNTALYIGVQALGASQAALDATSNNIANANTPGYTREVAQFSANQENFSGGQVTGGGVTLDAIQSIRDELLNLQIAQKTSQQSSADTVSASLQQVQTYFTNTGEDIASTLTAFSTSLSQLSASPTSSSAQQAVISAGQNLVDSFHATANGLMTVQTNADQQVTQTVGEINSLSTQIAQLNQQLSSVPPNGNNGGTLEDQRDQLVQQLSKLVGVSVTQGSSGEVITTTNGSLLVAGNQSFNLQTTTGTDGFQHVLDSNGTDITSSTLGGQLGGAIQVRDQTIPDYLNQLNTLATQFASAFNTAQKAGFDSNGNAGQNFFTVPATGSAAAGITAITDPSLIALSSTSTLPGDDGNVTNLSSVLTSNLSSGKTAAGAYSNLVFQVGNDASNASAQSSAVGQSLQALTNQQGSESGVNIDEETTNLIRYQTAYQAAARIVSTIQQLNTVTINMIS